MTQAHLRRLQKLEGKRARENCGIIARIVWERPNGKTRGPRVFPSQEVDCEELGLQLSLDFAGPDYSEEPDCSEK
jgi:hypothetical protein